MSPAKAAEPIVTPFRMLTWWAKEPCIRWGFGRPI